MTEFRIVWNKYPTNFNNPRVLFVEAASKDDARAVAIDHIERRFGVHRHDFCIGRCMGDDYGVTEVEPVPAGTVKER